MSLGVFGRERRECGRHHIVEEILRQTQAYGFRGHGGTQCARGFIVERDDLSGVGGQSFAGFGRYQASALAHEKLRA